LENEREKPKKQQETVDGKRLEVKREKTKGGGDQK